MKNFLAIAGNMGVGKSTLADKLALDLGWEYFHEPFMENPYLTRFYEDMKRWSLHTETFFIARRLRDHLDILKKQNSVIQDRSIYETEIFMRNNWANGSFIPEDWETTMTLFKTVTESLTPPDLIVYLEAPAEQCIQNITKRNREASYKETGEYVSKISEFYDEWARNFTLCPFLKINVDGLDFKNDPADYELVKTEILEKLQLPQTLF